MPVYPLSKSHYCSVTVGRTLVERMNSISGRLYRDDATIFAWDLVNEPRCETWRVRWAVVQLLWRDCSYIDEENMCSSPAVSSVGMIVPS